MILRSFLFTNSQNGFPLWAKEQNLYHKTILTIFANNNLHWKFAISNYWKTIVCVAWKWHYKSLPFSFSSWVDCLSLIFTTSLVQCWAKFVAPTGNFPASHEPNRNFKISVGHVPTSDNVNRNVLNFFYGHIRKK